MSRLAIPAVADAPVASQPLLDAVQKQLGVVPNLMKLLAISPAALEGYLSLSGALAKGALDAKLRETIALTVSEINDCDYCLAAHAHIGRSIVKLTDDEIEQARAGRSADARVEAALRFARRVSDERGRVRDVDIAALRTAGFSDAEMVEIVLHVGKNLLSNYLNHVAQTDLDFPRVSTHSHA